MRHLWRWRWRWRWRRRLLFSGLAGGLFPQRPSVQNLRIEAQERVERQIRFHAGRGHTLLREQASPILAQLGHPESDQQQRPGGIGHVQRTVSVHKRPAFRSNHAFHCERTSRRERTNRTRFLGYFLLGQSRPPVRCTRHARFVLASCHPMQHLHGRPWQLGHLQQLVDQSIWRVGWAVALTTAQSRWLCANRHRLQNVGA